VRLPRLLYFTLRCVCRAGRQGAGETGCRWRNRDYRHPLEVNPIKTVAGQPMWHCEHCGCAKSVCTADKREWLCTARAEFFRAILQTAVAAPPGCGVLHNLPHCERAQAAARSTPPHLPPPTEHRECAVIIKASGARSVAMHAVMMTVPTRDLTTGGTEKIVHPKAHMRHIYIFKAVFPAVFFLFCMRIRLHNMPCE
jgi:hypothetical protein